MMSWLTERPTQTDCSSPVYERDVCAPNAIMRGQLSCKTLALYISRWGYIASGAVVDFLLENEKREAYCHVC